MRQDEELARAGGRQLDMVEASAHADESGLACADAFNWLCAHALRLRVAPAYRDALAYLVASHITDLRQRPPFGACGASPLVYLGELFAAS